MDYRNRYRRGGIVGLQRGGSWWDRMVNSLQYNQLDERGLPGEGSSYVPQLNEEPLPERIASTGPSWLERELARSAALSTPEAMRKKAEDRRRYGLDGLPSPEEMEFISGPRERRGYTGPGPESQEGQRAAMLAEEADAPDNRMQLMRMLKDGRLTEEQYQAGMDNLMFGGAGRPRPEALLEEPAPTPAATADAEEAATTQAIAAAEAAAPSRPPLATPPTRSIREEMEDPYTWRVGGDHSVPGSFTNDAMIQGALREREMLDPLAGLMMSPEAPGSREDILADVRRRDLLEFPPVITDLLMEDQDPSVLRDEITRPPYIAPRHERALEGFEDLMIPGLPPAMDEQQRAELPPAMREAIPQARQARREARQAGATKALEEDMTKGMLGETRPEGLEAFLPGHSSYWDSMQDIPSDYSFDHPRPDLPEPSLFDTLDYEPHFLRDGGTGRRILENNRTTYDELGDRWFGDPLMTLGENLSGPIRYGDEVRIKPRSKNWLPYPMGYKEKMWEVARPSKFGRQTPEERLEQQRLMTTLGIEGHPMDHLRKMRALNALYYEPTEENPMGWRDPLAGTDYRRYQDGGVIPGYGIGGALGTIGGTLAGIFGGPTGAAAFGGLKGLFGKNKKKGFLKGILGGIIAGKSLGKVGKGLKEGWSAGAGLDLLGQLKSAGRGVSTDFTERILDPTLKSLSDPKMAAFVYPGYAQASRPDGGTDTSPGAMIAQQTPVMGASADPANWQDGRFIDPGQQKVAEIMRSARGGEVEQDEGEEDQGFDYRQQGTNRGEFDYLDDLSNFMSEPPSEGDEVVGNPFLDSDPGDYGTPVGRSVETTYNMNPYDEPGGLEEEMRRQLQQPDPLLQDPVGADPTHGLDDGGERPGDLGFVDQTALDPTQQFVENKFTGPAGHGIDMGHGYNQGTAPVTSTVPAKTGLAAGSVADHPDYVAGYHDETSKATGEAGASRVGLNPMKPQDQSALSQQQQDFISQFGKAEGGQIQEAPEQIRGLVKAALMGTLPDSSIDVTQLMAEVDRTYPGLIEAVANEIRAEQQMAGDGPPIVSEGYIPPFDDGMPESTGRVDDRAAVVSPMSDDAVAAGLERSLAEGGKVPISAVVAPEEYILDKQDTAASVQDLKAAVDHVAEASPTVSGPPMWDATRRRLDVEQGINA